MSVSCPIRIRRWTEADLRLGMWLKDQAGWNQTEADWRRFVQLGPGTCWVAEWEGRAAATTVAMVFERRVAWIAMVLVDPAYRGRGIATRLMEHALEELDRRGVATVRLDATPAGRPVYERLGFTAEFELLRMEGVLPERAGTGAAALAAVAGPEQLEAVIQLDAEASGVSRRRLWELLWAERPEALRALPGEGDGLAGYLAWRPGSRAWFIGPAAARTESAGLALAETAEAVCGGRRVFWDAPAANRPLVRWLERRGLAPQRPLTRMRRGRPAGDRPELLWGSSGPEKG